VSVSTQPSSSISWNSPCAPVTPAAWTRMSMSPTASWTAAPSASISSRRVTSAAWCCTRPSGAARASAARASPSGSRAVTNTVAPARSSSCAVCQPIPESPPVISAVLPVMRRSMSADAPSQQIPVGDPVGDDRAGGVPRALDLPHEHPDGPAPVVEVVDDAALGVVVDLEHLQGRVERADGLPAHAVDHRVEVRGVVVGGVGAGHRPPGGGTGFAGVVDVLDAGAAEDRIGVLDDVAGRPDRGVRGAQVLVDHDALGDLEARLAGQVEAG